MSAKITVPIDELSIKFNDTWQRKWLLITSGDFAAGAFNMMTVGWGSFGNMWNKPVVTVAVRPTRYTYEFTEKYDSFTICAFPEKYRHVLKSLGTKSGRYEDKINRSGLTPVASELILSPAFAEASLILECRKIYFHDLNPENFLAAEIDTNYPSKDYHRIYYGEILHVSADEGSMTLFP
ncbi:MAG: flavin reductase family protein [Ignavibacteriales bacterium]|nr:flavin reductase family protein [Ignavibacteriales bacterium]MCF8315827.1 flavin reductase family protein [Ignavibacteriales bacterium]MCF8437287.1 flavin reductase family protein [Ignavibacteriales bacterium]